MPNNGKGAAMLGKKPFCINEMDIVHSRKVGEQKWDIRKEMEKRERFIEMDGKEVDRKNDVERKGIFFLFLKTTGEKGEAAESKLRIDTLSST